MEGYGTASSGQPKYRIPKRKANAPLEKVYSHSPLSRIADTRHLDNPLQKLKLRRRNNSYEPKWKKKRNIEKCHISDEDSAFGQPKVILTNVLKTEIGRKYIKTRLITDANLSHAVKLQSDQETSSVGSVEIWQIFSPLHQSLFISKRQPKVSLTNVLRTKTGRKYMHLLSDPAVSDANKLHSGEQPSSSIVHLESCQKLSSRQDLIVPERYGRYKRKPNDRKFSTDAESHSALLTIKRCDVMLEDCSIKNKERDQEEKRRKDLNNTSLSLRDARFPNSESRKRKGDGFLNHQNESTGQIRSNPQKSPLKGKKKEPLQSPGCQSSSENTQCHIPQQENSLQSLELGSSRTFASTNPDLTTRCPEENGPHSSLTKELQSVASKDMHISPLVSCTKKQHMNTTLPLKKSFNTLEKSTQTANAVEPIVVSSDEEEGSAEAKSSEIYFQNEKSHGAEKTETKQESFQPLSEELSQGVTELKAAQVSNDLFAPHSSGNQSNFSEHLNLALDIKFDTLYIGNYRGKRTGCIRLTTTFIKIPFEVALNKKMELLVDTVHLKKFGLWKNNDDSSSLKSNAVAFLWLSSDYVEQIENQVGKFVLNKQAKKAELVFLKLSQLLTEAEQEMLNKIIVEVSKKNTSPELNDFLPWEKAVPLLEDILPEESSFLDHCYASFQQQLRKDRGSVLVEPSAQQESKSSIAKPSYLPPQKQKDGQSSFNVTSVEGSDLNETQESGPVRNLIVYPPSPAKGGLGVTKEDLECLEYGEFLNDVIIDFYLKYLLLEKAPKQLTDRSHIFSSFFYKCLTLTEKNSEENPNLSIAQKRHKRVKRWTRHINIFNKDYIFVPVNEESHWYIAVICFPWLEDIIYEDCPDQGSLQSHIQQVPLPSEVKNDTVRRETVLVFNENLNDKEELGNVHSKDNDQQTPELDSETSQNSSDNSKMTKICKRPCIVILDSLKASSVQNTVQVLREYLEVEWEAKHKTSREFNKTTMLDFCPKVPKQDNNSDCGVYLLQYVETFFKNPILNFELPMHLERWFPRQLVRSKRKEIRDLIMQLHLKQQSGSKS